WLDAHVHVQITASPPAFAGLTLAGDPDALPVADPRGNVDAQNAALVLTPCTPAGLTRSDDQRTFAAAGRAGGDHPAEERAESRRLLDLTVTAARRARTFLRTG